MDESRHVSVVIAAPWREVYAWAADPGNLPLWAAGLARSPLHEVEGAWVADSPMGPVTVRFAPPNEFGVLDHTVVLPDGEAVDNPMRVLAHGDGAEVVFTARRRAGMTEEDFAADVRAVEADLDALRRRFTEPPARR